MDQAVFATAPLRISFVGGGTDFPHWYLTHGGAVLSATIDHRAHIRVASRDDQQVRIRSLDLGHLVQYHLDVGPEFDGVMDLAKAAVARMGLDTGIDMDLSCDAPAGSGLGGSSAVVTAVVGALAALADRALSHKELAELSYVIERRDLGIAGGRQDQYAATFGGLNLIEFGGEGVRVLPVEPPRGTLARLAERLLLCYSGGVRRNVGLIDAQIRLYREGREETHQGMKQLQAMAYEMRDALEGGDVTALGPMLHEAYESKKRMNPRIAEDTPIEQLLAAARAAGAAGGKICGAGGGGYLLLYCEPEHQPAVRSSLERLGGQFASWAFHPAGVEARAGDRRWTPTSG